jgi:hypothetical protein
MEAPAGVDSVPAVGRARRKSAVTSSGVCIMTAYTEPQLTIADLEAMPEDGNRYELIDSELYVSTSPGFFH